MLEQKRWIKVVCEVARTKYLGYSCNRSYGARSPCDFTFFEHIASWLNTMPSGEKEKNGGEVINIFFLNADFSPPCLLTL